MSDELVSILSDLKAELPVAVKRALNAAIDCGWTLNPPGMTLVLRLNHPTDDLADPVYVSWVVGRTPTGRMSMKFDGASTRGLVPLSASDLLEYLADPTVAYMIAEEREAEMDAKAKHPKWDYDATPERNLITQLGGTLVSIDRQDRLAPRRTEPRPSANVRPLRVNLPFMPS